MFNNKITEDFLHFVWKFKQFHPLNLISSEGDKIEIINPGLFNTDSGPDFFNAKLKINDTIWAGNIEIHVFSSDWTKHKHQFNKAYNNVILHVVYENDAKVFNEKGNPVPTIALKDILFFYVAENYLNLKENNLWVSCQDKLSLVKPIIIQTWMERLIIDRLEYKSKPILQLFVNSISNWEEIFYIQLAHNFGFKINSLPFELVAKSISLTTLAKHKNNLFQLEALLFGQAGLLFDATDNYSQQLSQEYHILKKKFSLTPIDGSMWKFLRIRPVNFPTIRLAQFASLIYKSSSLFSKVLEIKTSKDIFSLFDVQASEYWQSHYRFDKKSTKTPQHIGKSAIENIAINTLIPFIFVYGKQYENDTFIEKALNLLDELPAENNSIIQSWEKLGIKPNNASQSQALIHLKNEYCSKKKCLNCTIGNQLLINKNHDN